MGRIGAAAVVAMLLAISVSADGPLWKYHESVNEMDDSVWRRVWASLNQDGWIAVVQCEFPGLLVLWWDKEVTRTNTDARLRFDKETAFAHHIGYGNNPRSIFFKANGMDQVLLSNVLLRIQLPAELTGASVSTVLRLDLLDFNQAWARCPEVAATNDE